MNCAWRVIECWCFTPDSPFWGGLKRPSGARSGCRGPVPEGLQFVVPVVSPHAGQTRRVLKLTPRLYDGVRLVAVFTDVSASQGVPWLGCVARVGSDNVLVYSAPVPVPVVSDVPVQWVQALPYVKERT